MGEYSGHTFKNSAFFAFLTCSIEFQKEDSLSMELRTVTSV